MELGLTTNVAMDLSAYKLGPWSVMYPVMGGLKCTLSCLPHQVLKGGEEEAEAPRSMEELNMSLK